MSYEQYIKEICAFRSREAYPEWEVFLKRSGVKTYRQYIEGVQIFGDNEFHPEWEAFLKRSGIEMNSDRSYEGCITDVMDMLGTVSEIAERLTREKGITSESGASERSVWDEDLAVLNRRLLRENAYELMPVCLMNAIRDRIQLTRRPVMGNNVLYTGGGPCFCVRNGMKIRADGKRHET